MNQLKEWLKAHKAVLISLIALLPVWLVVGLVPLWLKAWDGQQAGVFGDSFGFVNSLFSGFAFLIATYALIKQIEESRESGKIQERQASLQAETRRDYKRRLALEALLKTSIDAERAMYALISWRSNQHVSDQEQRVLKYAECITHFRGSLLGTELIFGNAAFGLSNAIRAFDIRCTYLIQGDQWNASNVDDLAELLRQIRIQIASLWNSPDDTWKPSGQLTALPALIISVPP